MTKAPTELDAERALRAALSQMGSHVGCAKGPVSGKNTKLWCVENTMSLAWKIGRAVALSRCTNTVDSVAEAIVAEVGGAETASVLFKGKIVGVERTLRMGHAYGEVVIEGEGPDASKEKLVIPFKNENIFAKKVYADGREEVCLLCETGLEHSLIYTTGRRHSTGPCHRTRCAKWRGTGHARLSIRPACKCHWHHGLGKVDVHTTRA